MSSQPSTFRITALGFVALAIAMGVGRFAFTPFLPLMQDDGFLTISEGGALASFHFLGYLLGALFVGKIPYSPQSTLRFSLFAIVIGTLGMGVTENFYAWVFLRWLCGVCSAVSLVLVSNFYVKTLVASGRPDKQGWIFAGVGAGIAIVGVGTLAIMVAEIGSAASWVITGVISLVGVAIISLKMGDEIPGEPAAKRIRKSEHSPLVWRIVIAYGAMGIGYVIPATYLPVMAKEVVQSPLIFGWSWPVFGTAAFVSTLLAARLQRGFSNRHLWASCQVVMAVGVLAPVLFPGIVSIIIAGVCVGGTFMIITMVGMKEAHRIAPSNDAMRHIAVMTAAFASGQMIGPMFAGALYDVTQSFSVPLVATSVLLIVTAGTLFDTSAP